MKLTSHFPDHPALPPPCWAHAETVQVAVAANFFRGFKIR